MHRFLSELLNYIYPPRCPICDAILDPGKEICISCQAEPLLILEPSCKKCGKPLDYDTQEYCVDCTKKKHRFEQGKAVFLYKDGMKKSMYRFKYSNRREYANFYAKQAAKVYGDWVHRNRVEVVIPIPMYYKKRRKRGYNQAEVFARALGKELGIAVDERIVERIRETTPQKELNDKQRQNNLKKAFQLTENIVKYKEILLVDDIYTTGSTMDAVAETLLAGGARNIYYICISIGDGF